jgi:hypothetical protein
MAAAVQDFTKDVMKIDAIPTKKLDTIKVWRGHPLS